MFKNLTNHNLNGEIKVNNYNIIKNFNLDDKIEIKEDDFNYDSCIKSQDYVAICHNESIIIKNKISWLKPKFYIAPEC